MIFNIWALFSGAGLIFLTVRHFQFLDVFKLLRDMPLDQSRPTWPKVSVIVPACNEAKTIGPAIESLLAMDYPNLEIIVVNDRSTDNTSTVLKGFQNASLKVVEISELPSDWLGKTHALYQGALIATGEWLLFKDADVIYHKQSLKKAIGHCLGENIDFLTVAPVIKARGILLQALMCQFMASASSALNAERISDPDLPDSAGSGAFNLVRRGIYESSKGFPWLKLDVIDDLGIAHVLKEEGARLSLLGGMDEVEIEWYPNLWSFVRGLEKNGFALFQYSFPIILSFFIVNSLFVIGYTIIPFVCGGGIVNAIVMASLAAYLWSARKVLRRLIPFSAWIIFLLPFAQLAMALVPLRSAILFLFNGGVTWRGKFYSSALLIANQRIKPVNIVFRIQ